MPTIDSGRPDEQSRFPPPGPESTQVQPQKAVNCAKAPIRPSEDTELVAQGQRLEQEIATGGRS